jgi:hypothetical protein
MVLRISAVERDVARLQGKVTATALDDGLTPRPPGDRAGIHFPAMLRIIEIPGSKARGAEPGRHEIANAPGVVGSSSVYRFLESQWHHSARLASKDWRVFLRTVATAAPGSGARCLLN